MLFKCYVFYQITVKVWTGTSLVLMTHICNLNSMNLYKDYLYCEHLKSVAKSIIQHTGDVHQLYRKNIYCPQTTESPYYPMQSYLQGRTTSHYERGYMWGKGYIAFSFEAMLNKHSRVINQLVYDRCMSSYRSLKQVFLRLPVLRRNQR